LPEVKDPLPKRSGESKTRRYKIWKWIVIGALALAGVGGMVLLAVGLERDREHIESELENLGSPATPTPVPEAALPMGDVDEYGAVVDLGEASLAPTI
jgi:hypothetical protein